MRIAWDRKELLLKVVYYGPPLAGKTTNLEQLQRMIDERHRSQLVSLDTHGDRTLYFDLMQVSLGRVGGLTPRVSLYTVPGQPRYERVRHIVLRGADGVVFVADSAPKRLAENVQSWRQMHQQLASLRLSRIPIVIQANKRDLPDALPLDTLRRALAPKQASPQEFPYRIIEARAREGIGVRETFMAILTSILAGKHA